MGVYHINEGIFELPEAWSDRTLHIFAESDAIDPAWNIVISRDKLSEGETLDAYVTRQKDGMGKALRQLKVVRDDETTLDGVPARELETTWLGEQGTVRQRQVVTLHKGRAMVFTLTVLDYLYKRHVGVMDEMLQGFRFRRA